MEYFIIDGSVTVGPFTKEQLKQKNVNGSTLVYTNETNWVEAKMISDLADVIRKYPPPPPPKQKEEVVYHVAATTQNATQSSKGWLYGLLVAVGLAGGGGFMYQEHTQTQNLQDEIRSKDMQKQEEQAIAEREKRKQQINTEKQRIISRIASLETELSVQEDKLEKVKEWELLRTSEERETQVRAVNTNMRSIESAIKECNVKLSELENTNL